MTTRSGAGPNTPLNPGNADHRERLRRALGSDYRLGDLLAQGGMGAVYVAYDRKLERDVAVKALRHDVFPTPLVLERFSREAKSLAKLRHPNILPVYAVGEGEGLAYMITPRIQGESLRDRLAREGRLNETTALRIAVEIARALEAAHLLGIVHRDVKPDNILLEGHDAHALLADFGIAKSRGDDAPLTASGMMVGSPRYMSPEQMGDESVDARSDIYSLGAVLYEMLAGRPPFEADSLQRLMMLQLTSDAPLLSSLAPQVDARVSTIVMKCLARNPADRWESAQALADAITGIATVGRETAPAERSVFDRRGLLLGSVNLILYYLWVARELLPAGGRSRFTTFVLDVVIEPLMLIGLAVLAGVAAEMVLVGILSRRRGRSRHEAFLAAWGQPRWWITWYPASLRHSADTWGRISLELKILRSLVFLGLVGIPVALPLIFIVPTMQRVAAGIPLPIPMANMIKTSLFMQRPLFGTGLTPGDLLGLWLVLGTLVYARRRRISLAATVRAIVSGNEPT